MGRPRSAPQSLRVAASPGLRRPRNRHPRRGGLPHQGHLFRRQAVRLVHQVGQPAFQRLRLAGLGLHGEDRRGVFLLQPADGGDGQGALAAGDLLHLGHQAVRVQAGHVGQLLRRLVDGELRPQPVEDGPAVMTAPSSTE